MTFCRRALTAVFALTTSISIAMLPGAPASAAPGYIQIPGTAADSGVGANGSAWIIGQAGNSAGGQVYHLESNGMWKGVPGNGDRIDVGSDGRPWVVNNYNEIYRWNGTRFDRLPGA